MATQVFEGTVTDIQEQLRSLRCGPLVKLQVMITTPEPAECRHTEDVTEFRNGVPLLPRRPIVKPVTLETVNELLNQP